MNPRRPAYTLVELVIVLMVLGVLAGVAAPRYTSALAWQRLEAMSLRVAADLRMARDRAVRVSSSQTVDFFPADDRYAIGTMADPDHADRRYGVRMSQTGYGVDLVSAKFGASEEETVTFDVYGRPSDAGVVTLAEGSLVRTIELSAFGEVTLP